MKKILHVLDHSLPAQDGYSYRSQNVLQCLGYIGLEPVVLTSPKHEAALGVSAIDNRMESRDSIRFYRCGALSSSEKAGVAESKLMAKIMKTASQVIERERPSLIHVHSPVLNVLPLILAARKYRIPVVYEIRAFWEDAGVDQGTYVEWGKKYRIVRWLETFACRRVNQIFTICHGLKNDLVERGINQDKIQVVPNAIVPENFIPVVKDRQLVDQLDLSGYFVLGFLGSFYHYEGLDFLIKAMAHLSESEIAFKLLLIGGGEQDTALKEQVREMGIGDSVIFTGRVPHEQVPGYYSILDALVLPRKRIRLTETVTPLKPLEAMAMQKAIIASDVGGHKEMIQDGVTGLLYPSDSPDALVACALKLAQDKKKKEQLEKQGYNWVVSERTWKNNALIYQRAYDRLID